MTNLVGDVSKPEAHAHVSAFTLQLALRSVVLFHKRKSTTQYQRGSRDSSSSSKSNKDVELLLVAVVENVALYNSHSNGHRLQMTLSKYAVYTLAENIIIHFCWRGR